MFDLEREIQQIKPIISEEDYEALCDDARYHVYLAKERGRSGEKEFLWICATLTYDNPEIVKYLRVFLENFDTTSMNNVIDIYDKTFLEMLIIYLEFVSLECFKMFFEAGLDVNSTNKDGLTSLWVLKNFNVENRYSENNLSNNEISEHIKEIIKLFVEYGARLNHCDNSGRTIIQLFSEQPLTELGKVIVETLMDNGAIYEYNNYYMSELDKFIASYMMD